MEDRNKTAQRGNTMIVVVVLIIVILVGIAIYLLTRPTPEPTVTPQGTPQQTAQGEESTQPTEMEGEPLPEEDAVGTKDLEVIGRYPGSVRTGYSSDDTIDRKAVDYVVKAPANEVKEYYIDNLGEMGWEIETSEEDQIRFAKEEATFFLNTNYDEEDKTLKYYLEYYPTSNY